MKSLRALSGLLAAVTFGAIAMVAQTLLLRRFLWRFEAAETGVAIFLSSWLLWCGLGAATSATPFGRRVATFLSRVPWILVLGCASLYFVQYALIGSLRSWLGVPAYESFPVLHLAVGCLIANAPFCYVSGWVVPVLCLWLDRLAVPVSRAFAWEALGAALGGVGLLAALLLGVVPDPRDEAEWRRYFPQAAERPGRFETGGGTTFYGTHGGSFYALSSGGVSEVIPENDRAMEQAALLLSQRPYAKSALLVGNVPAAVGLALQKLRPDLPVTWCPCDAKYGTRLLAVTTNFMEATMSAAGAAPQEYLERQAEGAFDAVLVVPPPATSLSGATWRGVEFIRKVRRVTQRTGVALFGLNCESVTLTPEKSALIDALVRPVRQVWPESGCYAPGAGGWWVAAQVQGLAYGADVAPARLALLKRQDVFPTEAVVNLYDAELAKTQSRQCSALDPSNEAFLPDERTVEDVLALGLVDAVREEYPDVTPGAWLAHLKACDGHGCFALVLVVLWMFPVLLGRGSTTAQRLLAAWLAACGALGLVVSLIVLYRLQMRFGALYLLAGAGSCLYLGGLYVGNRAGECICRFAGARLGVVRGLACLASLLEACVGLAVLAGAERVATAYGTIAFCFVIGVTAGITVPIALAASGCDRAQSAAVFVLADALGAAVAGVFIVAMVPLVGVWGSAISFGLLVCGLGLCVAVCGAHARLAAGLAVVVALSVIAGRLRDVWPERLPASGEEEQPADAGQVVNASEVRLSRVQHPQGIPRKLDVKRIRELLQSGALSTNAAAFQE